MKNHKLWLGLTIVFALSTAITIFMICGQSNTIDSLRSENTQVTADKNALQQKYSRETKYADSLKRANEKLYSQQQLTEAMNFRDSVMRFVPYSVGDYVMVKTDSSVAVVADIFAGGSKFDYHIRVTVQHKDRTYETLSPEMIEKR